MKPLFFVCGPRTRSSILFETMQPWAEQKYGLLPLKGHVELFLEVSQNSQFYNHKTGEKHEAELYPVIQEIAKEQQMRVHYIYPHVLKTPLMRNLYKLNILNEMKHNYGKNYNIKGTINIRHTLNEIVDFFSDRHFVITKRRNMEQNVVSLLYAFATKLFHAKSNNLERYKNIFDEGVHINQNLLDIIPEYIASCEQLYTIEQILNQRNIDYTVIYYEDMNTQEEIYSIIDRLYQTTEWRQYLPKDLHEHTPILLDKNYRHAIHNYEQVVDRIREHL